VRVQGRDTDGSILEEMSSCDDACPGGVSLRLQHPVRQGQVLFLSLPLPSRFRQYDVTAQSYRVYALVRSVVQVPGRGARLGLLFYGRTPPHGAESLPAGFFLMEGDQRPGRAGRSTAVVLRLAASQAPGGLEQEEQAVIEYVTPRGVRVTVTSLPVMKGIRLGVEEPGGGFRTGAEVENVLIGPDGRPHADLVFLDVPPPERWGVPEA
jgi:hypothetical protein